MNKEINWVTCSQSKIKNKGDVFGTANLLTAFNKGELSLDKHTTYAFNQKDIERFAQNNVANIKALKNRLTRHRNHSEVKLPHSAYIVGAFILAKCFGYPDVQAFLNQFTIENPTYMNVKNSMNP